MATTPSGQLLPPLELDGPVTLDTKEVKESASLINAFIPDLVRRRTGRLPSLRRTFTPASSPIKRQNLSAPPSPPPPYPENETARDGEATDVAACLDRLLEVRRPSSTVYHVAAEHSASEVRWKHVSEGHRLIECAAREAVGEDEDPELVRKMFIDGVGYLVKALPELEQGETEQLARYLPPSLRPASGDQQLDTPDEDDEPAQNNYIYRIVTTMTMYGILLASFLLPLLERFAAALYRCDQRYRISARVAETGTQTISAVARKVFSSLNEGRTGQVALGMTLYTMDGASRGFLEGYARAVKRQGAAGKVGGEVDEEDGPEDR